MQFDLIILGGGLVGLTQALLSAQAGFSIALIEGSTAPFDAIRQLREAASTQSGDNTSAHKTKPEEWNSSDFDIRCSTISRASQKIFKSINVWELMAADRISTYRNMVVWDAEGYGEITFHATEVAEPDLGHVIENRVMLKALWQQVEKEKLITVLAGRKPVLYSLESNHIMVQLNDHQTITAQLVIAADGMHSWLRQTAGIQTTEWDYQQQALVATVKTELSHQETAWQRFIKGGPVSFLPLTDPNTCSIVWSNTPDKVNALLALSDQKFCEELGFAFDYRLGKIIQTGERCSFPLKMSHAKHYIGKRMVLVGDSAHVFHPLLGQGLNAGLQDAKVLSEILAMGRKNRYDLGNYLFLRRYERARKGSVLTLVAAVELFKRAFNSSHTCIIAGRSMAFNAANSMQWIKKKLIRYAMGIE